MASEATGIALPSSLPYPLTLTRILALPGEPITRGSPIFEYAFTSATSQKVLARQAKGLAPLEDDARDVKANDMVGTWDSELQGDVERVAEWVKVGKVIDRSYAEKQAVWVVQPCDHKVQYIGMCAICGADMTQGDYMTRSEEENRPGPSKKQYAMTHDAGGVTVSEREAKALETQDKNHLLAARKLSLIVDLDQTIIHTTVEPTIGEWLDEIAAGKAKAGAAANASSAVAGGESSTPPGSPKKERNPNEKALRDVARFQLSDDLPPGYNAKGNGKGKMPPGHDRWYYTKPRPGLTRFLEKMNTMFEMHVYTMGTRSYADAVCKAIDPDGKYFGTRILSRDESGSSFVKDLQRLFPTDRNMAVIIDDRADVWKNDLSNLVKVIPYDFFGIGDINASFLPPRTDQPVPTSPPSTTSSPGPQTPQSPPSDQTKPDTDVSSADEDLIAKSKMLDELSKSRPLAKRQEEMEKEDGEADGTVEGAEGVDKGAKEDEKAGQDDVDGSIDGGVDSLQKNNKREERSTTPPGSPAKPRKTLLNPYDDELKRVGSILSRIHQSWYHEYDRRPNRAPSAPLPLGCDVSSIVSDIRDQVFSGLRFIFSGVIPLGQKPEETDIWQTAEQYGASLTNNSRESAITHCITATNGTEKCYRARKNGAKVVWVEWFHRCVALWERVDEGTWEVGEIVDPSAAAGRAGIAGKVGNTGEGSGEAEGSGQKAATPRGGALGLSDGERSDGHGASDVNGGNGANEEDDGVDGNGVNEGMDDETGGELDLGQDDWDALMKEAAEAGEGDSDDGSNFGTEGTGDVPSSPASIASRSRAGSAESEGVVSASASQAGSQAGSQPGTPKKRVRYADEEDLPLESFKDASPDDIQPRPKKRVRALLMPPGEGDDVPESNHFKYKPRPGAGIPRAERNGTSGKDGEVDAQEGDGTSRGESVEEEQAGDEGVEDGMGDDEGEGEDDMEDEFAAMLHAETD